MRILLAISLSFNILSILMAHGDEYDPCADSLHWEVRQINPYEDTLIVTDPYGD